MAKLTATEVKQAKPGDKDRKLSDGGKSRDKKYTAREADDIANLSLLAVKLTVRLVPRRLPIT